MAEEVEHLKETANKIFNRAQFKLHMWHSNVEELETSGSVPSAMTDIDQSYAKRHLGVKKKLNFWKYHGTRLKIKLGSCFLKALVKKLQPNEQC